MKCSVEDDADHGVEGVRRKLLRARDKVAGGVVDERVYAAKLLLGGGDGSFDSGGVADITRSEAAFAACSADGFRGFAQRLLAAPSEEHLRAQLGQPQRHRAAQSCPAACDENRASFQQVFLKHWTPPLPAMELFDENWIEIVLQMVRGVVLRKRVARS